MCCEVCLWLWICRPLCSSCQLQSWSEICSSSRSWSDSAVASAPCGLCASLAWGSAQFCIRGSAVDLPDSAAIVRLANLLKVCAYCDDPVQTEHSDQVNYGEMVACSALRISNWPFLEWLKLLPRSPHNLAHAPAYQTHHVTVWTCRNCRARLPARASGSSASTSSETAFSGVSEVSEVSESEL